MEYIAKITEEDGHWLVAFPDCPGCQTFGDTKADAVEMARDALEGWLETGLDHGDVPPRPAAHRGMAIAVGARLESAIRLRWLRDDLNLTQGQLAKLVGVSQQQIAKLEDPAANPTLGTLDAIATKAGVRLTLSYEPRQTLLARAEAAVRHRAKRKTKPRVSTRVATNRQPSPRPRLRGGDQRG
jgi:antitoxin HicB